MSLVDDALVKVADSINEKRRQELFKIYENADVFKELARIRDAGTYDKGNKSKSMRLLASLPVEVDAFFSKVYGDDYYKDPSFFKTRFTEWTVVSPDKQ